ncbi:MAG TPA: MMPL family transporter [Solirubrobacteraceae bacterium]|jgi:RND superfamily putative drug exporter|nr:MMPL family transporter [Solirubrobacteraceae bacterium]
MNRLLTLGARRPRASLAAWLVSTVILGIIGLNVGQHLSVTNLLVPGTESAHEAQLFEQQFGSSVSAPILLTGPSAALDREGPALVHGLAGISGAHVVSAWDGGSLGHSLRPTSTSALVLVAVIHGSRTTGTAIEHTINTIVANKVSGPVKARVSGLDAIGIQLESASLTAVHHAELIAIPILLIVLLLVFGSPAAAVIPAVLGFGTVFSGFGLISILGSFLPLTELATIAASMMGLALGVDYSLLVVSRFRDELTDPRNPKEIRRAATVAGLRAGRTVAFAGGAISVLMLCALAVAAGTLLLSAVVGVIIVAAVSVVSTILAAPAALALMGRRVAGGRVAGGRVAGGRLAGRTAGGRGVTRPRSAEHPGRPSWLACASRSPVIAAAALAALLAVGWQALSLATGPPDARQLPAGSSARHDYEAVSKSVGPGWLTPYEMLVVVHGGAITTLPRLDALNRAQQAIARDGDVAGVIGPGPLAAQARPLLHAQASVAKTNRNLNRSAHAVGALSSSLGQAVSGAGRVKTGFAQAAAAVQSLASGGAGSDNAVAALRAGLQQAATGSRLTHAGLMEAAHVAGRVVSGGRTAAAGATRLAHELGIGSATAASAGPRLRSFVHTLQTDAATVSGLVDSVGTLGSGPANASAQLATASEELAAMPVSHSDPHYAALASALQAAQSALANAPSATAVADRLRQASNSEQQVGNEAGSIASSVAQLTQSASRLELGARELKAGLAALEHGQTALSAGIHKLATSGAALTTGLTTLSNGTATLGTRLAALQSGAGGLAGGLAHEQAQAGVLTSALSAGQRDASAAAKATPQHSAALGTLSHSPRFFGSGYLVLAALEGTAAAQHAGVDFTVNVSRTGQSARFLIVPRSAMGSAATGALRHRLEAVAHTLAKATGAQVFLGGPAAQLRDYSTAASGRMPLLIAVLMVATFLMLMVVFRSLFAALVGIVLNLLSVGAAFGALSLLSTGSHSLIGGPGYVDALSVSAMFAAIFALSIDYQVFILMRIREGWLRTGSVGRGVDYGVARTARIVAGAAAVMVGVFLAFATSDVATVRQLGVGLSIAIALDATVVRLILLPFALRLGGRFTWWLPRWLDRLLPVLDIGDERRRNERGERPKPVRSPDAAPAPEPAPRKGAPRKRTRPSAGAPAIAGHRVSAVRELAPKPAAATVVSASAIVPLRREGGGTGAYRPL